MATITDELNIDEISSDLIKKELIKIAKNLLNSNNVEISIEPGSKKGKNLSKILATI